MRRFRYLFAPLLALLLLAIPSASPAQVSLGVSVHIGPPALPVYVQPVAPGDGYIWTPGYWAYGPDGYFWVPGTWVRPPRVGVLWTPGYWGWGEGAYLWHAGYWGPHVGFYGGINYGFGYVGVGYVGGRWNGGVFAYNTAVNNVNVTVVHNTYVDRTVINNVSVNRVSYNGGAGGINARPSAREQLAEHEQHVQPTGEQSQHEQAARGNRAQLASANHGQPSVAATAHPGAFSGEGVVRARGAGGPGGPGGPGGGNNAARNATAPYRGPTGGAHANGDVRPANSPGNPSRGNSEAAVQHQHANPQHQNAARPENRPQGGGERREGGGKPNKG